jgi:hypothetical protein
MTHNYIFFSADETTSIPSTTTLEPTTSTTTAAPIPTTPKPTPPVHPGIVNWTWTDGETKITCIMVQMAMQLNFTYENKGNLNCHKSYCHLKIYIIYVSDNKTQFVTYNIPVDSKVIDGKCDNDSQHISVKFGVSDLNSMLKLNFGMNTTTKYYNLTEIDFMLDVSELIPDAKGDFACFQLFEKQ